MDLRRWQGSLVPVLLAMTALLSCRKAAPPAPPSQPAALSLELRKGTPYLFTFAAPDGRFVTTDEPEEVPPPSRRLVRVVDPSRKADGSPEGTGVFVLDLEAFLARGRAKARLLSREAFETGALAQLPPGASSLLADRPADLPDAGTAGQPGPGGPGPVVTLYGTSWCGACRAARQYLSEKKIPFADKDVERDPRAARELAEKAARLGVPADRVPILEVRGRLLIGFDRARLEALLGEAT